MDKNLGYDGLAIRRSRRIGHCHDTCIVMDRSTADVEVVNGTSFTKAANGSGSRVDQTELQILREVARDAGAITR